MRNQCGVCQDGAGFYAWPCCGCGQQKRLPIPLAETYGARAGAHLSRADRQEYLSREFPGFRFRARVMPGDGFREAFADGD